MKILAVLVLAVSLAGCPSTAYHSAVVAEHDFTSSLQAFQQAELAEHTNGRIDPAEHVRIEGAVEKIANAAQVLVAALQSGANNITIQQDFTSIENALNALMVDGVFNVKNPQSQNLLAALTKSIQAILQNIASYLSVQTTTPITTVGPKGGI
jgi:Skp family chaperone for outer membrane proteins